MSAPVVLRAVSSATIGLGHAMRSRAVAQALVRAGVPALLLVDDESTALAVAGEGIDVGLADPEGNWLARPARAAWLDGFQPWTQELEALNAREVRTWVVENREARERATGVVYPALHYVPDAWDRAHPERVRGGPAWIPLAREILDTVPLPERDVDLLITFGGSDPLHSTERLLGFLAGDLRRMAVSVGIAMQPRRAELEQLITALPNTTLLETGAPLAPWMARSRAAVTALGTTLYELAYLGTPAWILANYEDDRAALRYYDSRGPHRPLGVAAQLTDKDLHSVLAEDFPALLSGRGSLARELESGAESIARLLLS